MPASEAAVYRSLCPILPVRSCFSCQFVAGRVSGCSAIGGGASGGLAFSFRQFRLLLFDLQGLGQAKISNLDHTQFMQQNLPLDVALNVLSANHKICGLQIPAEHTRTCGCSNAPAAATTAAVQSIALQLSSDHGYHNRQHHVLTDNAMHTPEFSCSWHREPTLRTCLWIIVSGWWLCR